MNAHELKQLQVRLTKAKAEREIAWAAIDPQDGMGNVPPEIEVCPCEWCEDEACQIAVEEERRREI